MDWNDVFAGEAYHYGTEPAGFVQRQMGGLGQGTRVLTIAEGEGRNAVWLAGQGYRVTALEQSTNALAKARQLAETRCVEVDWRQGDLAGFDWPEAAFDAVLGCFFQFAPPDFRTQILAGMARSLKPGGTLFIHGFSIRQMANTSGGPKIPAQLYTVAMLKDAFPGWKIKRAEDYDGVLGEGRGHEGRAALVDFIAGKPEDVSS